MQHQPVFAVRSSLYFDLPEDRQIADPGVHGFEGCFLGGKAGRISQARLSAAAALLDLFPSEDALVQQPIASREFPLHAAVFEKINP